jgi:hypothetical protein
MEWLVAYLIRKRQIGPTDITAPASELKSRLDRFLHNFNFRRIVPHLNVRRLVHFKLGLF